MEIVGITDADAGIDNDGVVRRIDGEVKTDEAVAPKWGLKHVLIFARSGQRLAKEIVHLIGTDGFCKLDLYVGMHHDRDTGILGGTPIDIGHMAGVSCRTQGRRSHRMLCSGIAQGIGGCPAVGVMARAVHGCDVQSGGFALTKRIVIGASRGRHAAHIDSTCRAAHYH